MHSSQIILALSLVATAAPALAAPLPAPSRASSDNLKFARAFEAELAARAPVSFGPLAKEFAKGLAGGAGLSALFGGITALTGGDQQKRELDERGIGQVLGKLVGTADDLATVIKNGAIGGAAFGTSSSVSGGLLDKIFGRDELLEVREPLSLGPLAKEFAKGLAGGAGLSALFGGITALTGGSSDQQRRDLELTQEEADAVETYLASVQKDHSLGRRQAAAVAGAAAKSGLGKIIGGAIVGGLGSALGGFGVDKIFSAFQSRDLSSMTQEDADELERELEQLMKNNNNGNLSRRQGVAGAVAKSGLGKLIGGAVVGGLGSALGGFGVDKIFDLFQRRDLGSMTQEDADALERELERLMSSPDTGKRDLDARAPLSLGPISKGLIGLATSLGVSTVVGQGLDAAQGLFQREEMELEAREPISLGPISKGLIGLGTSLGVSTIVGQGLDAVQGLFQREASLNELD